MFRESLGMFFMVFIQIWSVEYSRKRKFIQDLSRCRSNNKFKHVRVVPLCFSALTKSALTKIWLVKFQLFKKKVLAPFQRFIPIYPNFSFRFQFPFPRFIPTRPSHFSLALNCEKDTLHTTDFTPIKPLLRFCFSDL